MSYFSLCWVKLVKCSYIIAIEPVKQSSVRSATSEAVLGTLSHSVLLEPIGSPALFPTPAVDVGRIP